MRLVAAISDLRKQMQRATAAGERAVRYGVEEATESLKGRLRYQTRGAGLGGRLANTWRSKTKPSGPSFDSDGMVWTKAPHIFRSHGFGAVIKPVRGATYLAIPTEAAGKGRRGARITPHQWERKTGRKLKFVAVPGKNPILVAEQAVGFNKSGVARISKAQRPRKPFSVVIFRLVKTVRLPKRMDIKGAAMAEINLLPRYIGKRWRKAA